MTQAKWTKAAKVASLPAAASDRHVEDAFEGPAVVGPGAAGAGPGRQQRLNELPLLVAQLPELHLLSPLSRGESTAKRVLRLVRCVQGPGREQEVGKRTLTYEKQKW
jgi:hypothetical protein